MTTNHNTAEHTTSAGFEHVENISATNGNTTASTTSAGIEHFKNISATNDNITYTKSAGFEYLKNISATSDNITASTTSSGFEHFKNISATNDNITYTKSAGFEYLKNISAEFYISHDTTEYEHSMTTQYNSSQYTTSTGYEALKDISDRELLIYTILMLIILLLGTFGNVVAFLVFQRRHLTKVVTTFYYRTLVLTDIAILSIGLMPEIIKHMSSFDLLSTSVLSCRVLFWALHFCTDFESWVLIIVGVERVFGVYYPHKIMIYWTKHKAWVSLFIIGGLSLLLNIPTIFVYDITMDDKLCSQSDSQFAHTWMWVDTMLFSIIPIFLLMYCNVGINWNLLRVDKAIQKHSTNRKANTSMALIMISMFFSFVLLTPSRIIVSLLMSYTVLHLKRAELVTSLIFYVNYAIKCVIYRSICPRFTQQFKEFWCCDNPDPSEEYKRSLTKHRSNTIEEQKSSLKKTRSNTSEPSQGDVSIASIGIQISTPDGNQNTTV